MEIILKVPECEYSATIEGLKVMTNKLNTETLTYKKVKAYIALLEVAIIESVGLSVYVG